MQAEIKVDLFPVNPSEGDTHKSAKTLLTYVYTRGN